MTLADDGELEPGSGDDLGPPGFALLMAKLAAAALAAGTNLGAATVTGGVIILEQLLLPHLRERQVAFLDELAERLQCVEQRLSDLDEAGIQRLVDGAVSASIAAVKHNDQTRRDALLNAVINTALPGATDDLQQQIFFAMVDRYTGLHVALLRMFDDPSSWRPPDGRPINKSSARAFVSSVFPTLRDEVTGMVWADLYHDGLVNVPVIDNGLEGPTVPRKTTSYGRTFVEFVKPT
jgi:hypothetical protein